MATHRIEPATGALHGAFSRDFAPVLTIDAGDTVEYRTLDAGWGLAPYLAAGVAREKFEGRNEEKGTGHALCGPVFIQDALPGMTLEVHINAVVPGAWGFTVAGTWPNGVNERLGLDVEEYVMAWTLDAQSMTGRNQLGHTVALRPFMGVMGMPPAEPGTHSTTPPRVTGGNIDCKELVAGTTLYLPIAVEGGLFSVGDGHAAQADGELSGTAIECPMEHVSLTFGLRDDLRLKTPIAETAEGWLTFGFDKDLDEAVLIALDAMLDLMMQRHNLARHEALALASTLVDMRVTQIVNQVRGAHAMLPNGAIR
ncbi:MAG: acetamidase/formamidase family protein [Chloroflexia bacterium]